MSKSVYSIVLNDEVVDMVDKMARANGVSRSLMIEKLWRRLSDTKRPKAA